MVNRPGRSYWFLTLTVPNQANITKWDISYISKKFATLWESWVFQGFEDEKGKTRKIFGGVRSIECVWEADSNTWHPHIHVLFEAPKKLPFWWLTLLKAKWLEITGDARYVHLKQAYSVTKDGREKRGRLNRKALREVCKYVTKSAAFAGDHLLVDEFLAAFKGVRRIQCFGAWQGKAAKEEFMREPGEDLDGIRETLKETGWKRLPFKAGPDDYYETLDGEKQASFAFMERAEQYWQARSAGDDPPWVLTPEPCTDDSQRELPMNPGIWQEPNPAQAALAFAE